MPKIKKVTQIVDINLMKSTDKFIAETMGVAIMSFDSDGVLTEPTNYTDFCISCTKCNSHLCDKCENCHHKIAKKATKKGEPIIFECCSGLTLFMIPVMIKDKYMGTLMGGQVLTESFDEDKFRKMARDLGLDENKYIEKAKKIKIIPIEAFKIMVDLIFNVANSIANAAYMNFKLSNMGHGYNARNNISLAELISLKSEEVKTPSFTQREQEVLKRIVLGEHNTKIAKELFISVPTVKVHVTSILRKLEVEDRVQVAVKAIKKGLV